MSCILTKLMLNTCAPQEVLITFSQQHCCLRIKTTFHNGNGKEFLRFSI